MTKSTPSGSPRRRVRGFALALASATCYGLQGLFYTLINQKFGLASETMVFFRTGLAFVALAVLLPITMPKALRVRVRDLPLLAALGLVCMGALFLVIANSVLMNGVAVTEVLLFTGPLWISLYAWRFLDEGMSVVQAISLVAIVVGAALVSGLTDPSQIRMTPVGLAVGLGGGLLLGTYTILSKYALRRYSTWTVMFYGLAFAWPAVTLTQDLSEVWRALTLPGALPWLIGLALGPSLLAAMLYFACLQYLPASVAGVVSTWEPVVATILAFLILGERLTPIQLLGGALIVGSIVATGLFGLTKGQARQPALEVDVEEAIAPPGG